MNYTDDGIRNMHWEICKSTDYAKCRFVNAFWIAAPFFLIISGTVMNLFCLIVLVRRRIRKYSTTIFLMFLACSDCFLLWTNVFRSLMVRFYKVDIRSLSEFSCHVTEWLTYTAGIFSSCILVCISAERCLLAKSPTAMRRKINARSTFTVSVVTLAIVAIVSGHSLFGHEYVFGNEYVGRASGNLGTTMPEYVCKAIGEGYGVFYNKYWTAFLFCFNMASCFAIITCNTCTAVLLRRQAKRVQPANAFVQAAERRRAAGFTVLLVVTSYYVIMTLPFMSFLLYLKMTATNIIDDDRFPTWQMIYVILVTMFWSNNSFNFLLYFMSGSNFRKECKSIIEDLKKCMPGN